jgi:dihydropteroate synthase
MGDRTYLMGILNVTPDSFYDGGRHDRLDRALEHAERMAKDGADIIDVGGESTRPGAEPVSLEEEMDRTIPVIEALSTRVDAALSIDTYKSRIAEGAVRAGAEIINDVSGLRFDPEMAGIAARLRVPVVLMHIKGTPRDMQKDPRYEDVVKEISEFLSGSLDIAQNAGIPRSQVVIDPGIGFGKTLDHNLEILRRIDEFKALRCPLLVGVSRKSSIGALLGDAPPDERLEGTLALNAYCILKGVDILRVHDVREHDRIRRVLDPLRMDGSRG